MGRVGKADRRHLPVTHPSFATGPDVDRGTTRHRPGALDDGLAPSITGSTKLTPRRRWLRPFGGRREKSFAKHLDGPAN